MNPLIDLLILLIAAKVTAEGAERIGLPPVVGEILAGVAIGPSLLGLVKPNELLLVLAQIGVILLLLEVGLEMDLGDLRAVGRAAVSVAVIGVVVPFAAGFGVGLALGWETNEAIFVGAALTATSVGISARVFGDLKALATVEARTVLGAAVVDDVLGLIILTVVVRLVDVGSVSLFDVGKIMFVAVAFLVAAVLVGLRFVPPVFAAIGRHSRSPGTLVALALAFALGVSELASAAKLAPIVGAFVAGIVLARAPVADRVRRELAPVGHLLVPVFFLQIGIDTDVRQFLKPSVLAVAGLLLVVGVIGKLVASAGMLGAPGDRLLVGIGMLPRGEVGLIFATIGLSSRVFGEDIYAALLLMVLVSTLITPPLLRTRLLVINRRRAVRSTEVVDMPAGGWLQESDGVIELAATPPTEMTLLVTLQAALSGERARPGPALLDWLGALPDEPLRWDDDSRTALFDLLSRGGPRAWRFLAVTSMLERALPELSAAVGRRSADAFDLDPVASLRWPRLGRLRELVENELPANCDDLALAAVILDAGEASDGPPAELARRMVERLGLYEPRADRVIDLVRDADLLVGTARRIDGFDREVVLQLAEYLGTLEHVRSLGWLVRTRDDLDRRDRDAVGELEGLLIDTIERPSWLPAAGPARERRTAALSLTEDVAARELLVSAPDAFVITQTPVALARQARLCAPRPQVDRVRVATTMVDHQRWIAEIVTADRTGVLAHMARALDELDLDIGGATSSVWADGRAITVFVMHGSARPSDRRLASAVEASLARPLEALPAPHVELTFDDSGSPWHTMCTVRALDRRGLLASIAVAFASAGVSIAGARVATVDGVAVDQFELVTPGNHRLGGNERSAVAEALFAGSEPLGRRSAGSGRLLRRR